VEGITRECLSSVVDIAFPIKMDMIFKFNLSLFTIGRRVEYLPNNAEEKLKRDGH
jgi:hypothetical protein